MKKKSNKLGLMCISMSLMLSCVGIIPNKIVSANYIVDESVKNKANVTRLKDGKFIFWAEGINPPDYYNDFITTQDATSFVMEANYKPNQGWYDLNKLYDGYDDKLCFGVTSANMFQWWIDQNSSYIQKYIVEQEGKMDPVLLNELKSFLNSPQDRLRSSSAIFQKILKKFPMKAPAGGEKDHIYTYSGGGWADRVLDFFINGYAPKTPDDFNFVNDPSNYIKDPQGGYFYDVFGKKTISKNPRAFDDYKEFSELVVNTFANGGMIGLPYSPKSGDYAHIITAWGAETDSEGNVTAFYTSDSDLDPTSIYAGMTRMTVYTSYDSSNHIEIHLSNLLKDGKPTGGPRINSIYTLSLGRDDWDRYFDKDLTNIKHNVNEVISSDGKLSFSSNKASKGEQITITNNANPGLVSDGYLVYPSSVKIVDNKFIIPDSNVNIIPKYKKESQNNKVDMIDKIELVSMPEYKLKDKFDYSKIQLRIYDTKKGLQEVVTALDPRIEILEFKDQHIFDKKDTLINKITIRAKASTYQTSFNFKVIDKGVYYSIYKDGNTLLDGKFLLRVNGYLVDGKYGVESLTDENRNKDIVFNENYYDMTLTISNDGYKNAIKSKYGYLTNNGNEVGFSLTPSYEFDISKDDEYYLISSGYNNYLGIPNFADKKLKFSSKSWNNLYELNDSSKVVNFIDEVMDANEKTITHKEAKSLKDKYDALDSYDKVYLDTFKDNGVLLKDKINSMYENTKPVTPEPEPEPEPEVNKKFTIDDVSLSNSKFVYDGKEHLPSITIKTSEGIVDSKYYSVTYPSNSILVGDKTITITGKDIYKDSKVVITYKITKADNKINSFEVNNDTISANATFDADKVEFRYYKNDSDSYTNNISLQAAKELNEYYIRAYIPGTSNYNEVYSNTTIKVVNKEDKPIVPEVDYNDKLDQILNGYLDMDLNSYLPEDKLAFENAINEAKDKINSGKITETEFNTIKDNLANMLEVMENNKQEHVDPQPQPEEPDHGEQVEPEETPNGQLEDDKDNKTLIIVLSTVIPGFVIILGIFAIIGFVKKRKE